MIKLEELSKKQLIGVLGYYNSFRHARERMTFTEFLEKLEKGTPWHENAPVIFRHGNVHSTISHGFYNLTEYEEELVERALTGEGNPYPELRAEMERQGMTGYRLAKLTDISTSDIYTTLNGQKPMYQGYKDRIAKALGKSVEELFHE